MLSSSVRILIYFVKRINRIKRMVIASNLISRVIGRAGCNVNAIRHVTGAQIDIDKMMKGEQQRVITLK